MGQIVDNFIQIQKMRVSRFNYTWLIRNKKPRAGFNFDWGGKMWAMTAVTMSTDHAVNLGVLICKLNAENHVLSVLVSHEKSSPGTLSHKLLKNSLWRIGLPLRTTLNVRNRDIEVRVLLKRETERKVTILFNGFAVPLLQRVFRRWLHKCR